MLLVADSVKINRSNPKEWFAGESFWRNFYMFMFSEERFAEAAGQIPKLLRLVKPKGKAILDLCCGPGRFAVPLAARGFRVIAVDKTGFLLKKAKARAKAAKVSVEWVREDMRRFVRPNAFNLALNMFTSFGYFEDKREDELVLANIFRSLRPGGALLMDMMGKEIFARTMKPAMADVLPDGSRLIQRPEVFDSWTRVRQEWTLIRDGVAKTAHFENTIYSGQELKDLLLRAGFSRVDLYGSMDGEAYDWDAKRLIAVAAKAGPSSSSRV